MNSVKTEEVPKYGTAPAAPSDAVQRENDVIEHALSILMSRLRQPGETMHNPDTVMRFLKLRMAHLEHEVFACLFLDNRHRVIDYAELFRGTVDDASVYPREVVKEALARNAAAVVFAHNHPSGVAEPSQADLRQTRRLKEALGICGIRTLDHVVIGGMDHVSFAQRGLL